MVAIPSAFAIYTVGRFATGKTCTKSLAIILMGMLNFDFRPAHNDVQWSKTTKSKSVAAWYEDKYPGTKATTNPGARYQ